LGTIAFFADKDALLSFARSPEHHAIMRWVMEPGNAHGGFIRLYEALPFGYSSGCWRAEPPHVMRHIDHFTPLTTETQGPPVSPILAGMKPIEPQRHRDHRGTRRKKREKYGRNERAKARIGIASGMG